MDENIKRAIEKELPPKYFEIYAMYDGGNRILFGIRDRRYSSKQDPLDPWYTIDKKTYAVRGFQPPEDWDFFNTARENPINL